MKNICAFLFLILLPFTAIGEEKVNINTADQQTLMNMIKGVGEKRAAAILLYRKQHGPFESVNELTEIKGINASILEKNRNLLTIE